MTKEKGKEGEEQRGRNGSYQICQGEPQVHQCPLLAGDTRCSVGSVGATEHGERDKISNRDSVKLRG
jgi:hypothetical protein